MAIAFETLKPLADASIRYPGLSSAPLLRSTFIDPVDAHPALAALARAIILNEKREASPENWLSDKELDAISVLDDANLNVMTALVKALMLSDHSRNEEALSALLKHSHAIPHVHGDVRMIYHWRAGTQYFKLRLITEARESFALARNIAIELDRVVDQALLVADIANADLESGDPAKALAGYEAAYRLLTDVGTQNSADMVLVNIATANQRLGRHKEAVTIYEPLIERWPAGENYRTRLTIMLNLANAYRNLEEFSEARRIYDAILHESTEYVQTEFRGRALLGLASTSALQGLHNEALQTLNQARELFVENGMVGEVTNVDGIIADTLWELQRHEEALTVLTKAFNQARETSYTSLTLNLGSALETMYTTLGRYEDAYQVLRTCSELKGTVYEKESDRAIQISRVRMAMTADREAAQLRENERRRVLHNVLPAHIADRLMDGEQRVAERLPFVGVLFADIVGFTHFAATMQSDEVLASLEGFFQAIDRIVQAHGCQRIKTIGDAYMASSGLSTNQSGDQIINLARCALDVIDLHQDPELNKYSVRIGIHAGPVVAGVMRGMLLAYDMWGDTVNIASRMENVSQPGKVRITDLVAQILSPIPEFAISDPEEIDVKGLGLMQTYWVERPH